MKYFASILLLLLAFSTSFAQEEPSETLEFPTINNNDNIDLNKTDTVRCTSGEHPDSARKRKEHRRAVQEIVKGKNFGFYTDIINGLIVLIVGFIGWKVYQRFGTSTEDEDLEENE